jgi:hypothetical protein
MKNQIIHDDELTLCRNCTDLTKTSASYDLPTGTEITIKTSCRRCSNEIIRKIVVSDDYVDFEDTATECA